MRRFIIILVCCVSVFSAVGRQGRVRITHIYRPTNPCAVKLQRNPIMPPMRMLPPNLPNPPTPAEKAAAAEKSKAFGELLEARKAYWVYAGLVVSNEMSATQILELTGKTKNHTTGEK